MKGVTTFMLFLCCYVTNIMAQPFTGFQKVEGLNSNVVYCVMQDSKGYIWVGTEAGAARYDGYKFTFFTVDDGLTDNDIFQIKEDSKGRLWFLNNSGKPSIYDNGKILNENNTKWLQAIQPKKLAIDFLEIEEGNIWFATLDTAYHLLNDKVVQKVVVSKQEDILNNILKIIFFEGKYALVTNNGVFEINTKKLFPFDDSKKIYETQNRITIYNNVLYYFCHEKLYSYSLQSKENKCLLQTTVKNKYVNFLKPIVKNCLLISTIYDVFELNVSTGKLNELNRLSAEIVSGFCEDNEGNNWLSSLTKGLWVKINPSLIATKKLKAKGLLENLKCWSLSKINNAIYFGYDDANFVALSNASIQHYELLKKANRRKVLQLYYSNNTQFIVTGNALIQRKGLQEKESWLSVKQIEAKDEALFLATSVGLIKVENKYLDNLLMTDQNSVTNFLTTDRIYSLLIASKDSIWVGGILGLNLFINEKKVSKLIWKQPIVRGFVTKIRKGKNGEILFSTNNKGIGIIYGDTIFTINQSNGLLSNTCNDIFVNNNGNIWVATSKGINQINYSIQKNKSIKYTIENYSAIIQTATPNINAVLQSSDTLFLAADDGAYVHLLSKNKKSTAYPKLHFQQLLINDSIVPIQNNDNLSYNQNRIRINFVGLAFQANGKIKYRYKLDPIDTNWHETDNTFVDLSFLSPEKYHFILTAALPNGNWNPNPITLSFTINPPFWKRLWFIVFSLLLGAAFIVVVVRYIIQNLKQKHALENKQLMFEKQLMELEHKALRLQMNPHFIFNAINAIKGYYASNNIEKAKDYVDTFSSLMRLMLETGNDTAIKLSDELTILDYYLQLSALRYENKFSYTITTNLNTSASQIQIPIMLLQPFVENAVIHGVAPLRSNGIISVHIQQQQQQLIFTIEDNGVGRNIAAQNTHKQMHLSKSITITEQRLKIIGQNSKLTITDKLDDDGNTNGTLVEIVLPLNYDA